jgi:hypothetical protein
MFFNAKQSIESTANLACWIALALNAQFALADQAVYKCGQEITNQPIDPKLCQQLNISQPTQIDGTRVQPLVQKGTESRVSGKSETPETNPPQAATSLSTLTADAPDRKAQARTILEDEWQKLTTQYTELVHLYNRGQPTPLAGESLHQPNYQQRTLALKAQLQRVERDLQALQRELGRHGVRMSTLQSK